MQCTGRLKAARGRYRQCCSHRDISPVTPPSGTAPHQSFLVVRFVLPLSPCVSAFKASLFIDIFYNIRLGGKRNKTFNLAF